PLLTLPPTSPRFPYTTLFRSDLELRHARVFPTSGVMHTDCRKAVGGHTTRLHTSTQGNDGVGLGERWQMRIGVLAPPWLTVPPRSEEHTSELQSRENLVCRLL